MPQILLEKTFPCLEQPGPYIARNVAVNPNEAEVSKDEDCKSRPTVVPSSWIGQGTVD
jgi:hypothetical protein